MSEERYTKRENRTQLLSVTVTPSDDALIRAAARRTGLTVSSFVAKAASQAAQDQLAFQRSQQARHS